MSCGMYHVWERHVRREGGLAGTDHGNVSDERLALLLKVRLLARLRHGGRWALVRRHSFRCREVYLRRVAR
jgi:hypothetical protein